MAVNAATLVDKGKEGAAMARVLICCAALLASLNQLAYGAPPPLVPLPAMIARAKAVAIGRVAKMEPLVPVPEEDWNRNRRITITIQERLRGELPDTVTIEAEVSQWRNQGLRVGDQAVLFVGQVVPLERQLPDGQVSVFEGAQGFVPIHPDREVILRALRKAIAGYRSQGDEKPALWETSLNHEAAQPLVELFASKDVEVRRWAARELSDAFLSQCIAQALVTALDDPDREVRSQAAHRLFSTEYHLRADAVKDDGWINKMHGILQGEEIGADFRSRGGEIGRIVDLLAADCVSFETSVWFEYRVSTNGTLAFVARSDRGREPQVAALVDKQLPVVAWNRLKVLPFHFRLHLWRTASGGLFALAIPIRDSKQ